MAALKEEAAISPIMETPMVEIEHLSLWYGEKLALKDVGMLVQQSAQGHLLLVAAAQLAHDLLRAGAAHPKLGEPALHGLASAAQVQETKDSVRV